MTEAAATTVSTPIQPIRPPYTAETTRAKVQAAEDAWNTRNPDVVARTYTEDSQCAIGRNFLLAEKQLRPS